MTPSHGTQSHATPHTPSYRAATHLWISLRAVCIFTGLSVPLYIHSLLMAIWFRLYALTPFKPLLPISYLSFYIFWEKCGKQ